MKSLTVFTPAEMMFSANLASAEVEPLPMWASVEEQPPSAKIELSEARQSAKIETFELAEEATFEPVEESSKDVKIESSNGSCNGDHHSVHSSARSSTAFSTKDNCVIVIENGNHLYSDSHAPTTLDGCAVQSRKPLGLEHIGVGTRSQNLFLLSVSHKDFIQCCYV